MLIQCDWNYIYTELEYKIRTSATSADVHFNDFLNTFLNLYNAAFKITPSYHAKGKNPNNKSNLCPWITPQLLRCCRVKSKLFKLYRRFKTNVARIKYKNYSKILKYSLIKAEKLYYSNLLHNKQSISDIWKTLNVVMNPGSEIKTNTEFLINGIVSTDSTEICQEFNKFFTTIGQSIAESIDASNDSPLTFLG